MSKESINAEIESFTTSDGNETAKPAWDGRGIPECSESCRWHDGKRCGLLGQKPGPICEPTVVAMRELLEDRDQWLSRLESLKCKLQTHTETMLALRGFVEMIASKPHWGQLPNDIIEQAKDLLLKVTR